jgi:UDP-N-acetylmuramoyl-L-alanyl-D-glutamate--2,6-diaminopimelate ligase
LLGLTLDKIAKSVEEFEGLPGRLEKIEKDGRIFFIDFAHTPKALESVLEYLSSIKKDGRLILVFGAPGNRDPFKRPIMGQIADKYADIIVLTDDDPSKENRYDIISQIRKGISRKE